VIRSKKKLWTQFLIFKTLRMKSLILALAGAVILSSFSLEKNYTNTKDHATPETINPLHSVPVTDVAGLLIDGTLDVTQFITNNNRLWAVCKLKGKIGMLPIYLDCVVPITVTDCDGGIRVASPDQGNTETHDCECITIIFESCVVPPPIGPALTISPQEVPCSAQEFSGDALCCVNRLVGTSGSSIHEICGCMNRLL
jgi:hypothetical protein